MPVDVSILGFSNRWYPAAIETAQTFDVAGHDVRVVTPALFIAAKLVAFHGRGGDDVFASHDLEDRARRDALIEEAIVDAYRPTRATSWSGTSTRRCISHTGSTWKSRSGIPSALST